jgi:mannosyltransferase
LRSLSALLGVAAIPLFYAAARELADRRAALAAAALSATSPLLIWYSQEARAYALLVLLSAASFLFFTIALKGQRQDWLWGWAAASALAIASHYFAVLLVAPEALWLLWRRREQWRRLVPPFALLAVAAGALAVLARAQAVRPSWIELLDLGDRLLQVPQQAAVGLSAPWEALAPLVAVALAVVVGFAVVRGDRSTRDGLRLAGGVALAGFALALATAAVGNDFLITRNLLALWPPAIVAISIALTSASPRWLGLSVIAAVCILGIALASWAQRTPEAQRPDWDQLASELGSETPSKAIVGPDGDGLPLLLYLEGSERAPETSPTTADEVVLVDYAPVNDYGVGPCWWGAVCGGERLFPVSEPPSPETAPRLRTSGETERLRFRVYEGRPSLTLPPPTLFQPYVLVGPPAP